jgi:hypothetical protein
VDMSPDCGFCKSACLSLKVGTCGLASGLVCFVVSGGFSMAIAVLLPP